jgi:ATP-binding cassette, subfamily B (MDR/TAP), member 1
VFQLQGSEAIQKGNFWALMFFVVALGNLVIYFSTGILCNTIVQVSEFDDSNMTVLTAFQKVTHKYRLEAFKDTIKQDPAFFDQEHNATGAIASQLSTTATDLHELLGLNSSVILNNIVTVIACAILGIAYGWKLGLACSLGALPPILVAGYARVRLDTKLDNDTAQRFASSAALATEAVGSIKTVASLTLEAKVVEQYHEKLSTIASQSIKTLISTMLWYSLTQSINFLAMALGFWYVNVHPEMRFLG